MVTFPQSLSYFTLPDSPVPAGVIQDVVQYSISKIGTRRLAIPKPERCRGAALHSQVAYRSVLFKRPLKRVWTAKLYVIKNTMSTSPVCGSWHELLPFRCSGPVGVDSTRSGTLIIVIIIIVVMPPVL